MALETTPRTQGDEAHARCLVAQARCRQTTGSLSVAVVNVEVPPEGTQFQFSLCRDKLRLVRKREGRYLLRTNMAQTDPARLWEFYIQMTHVEEAFKNLKGVLALRPIYHQKEERIEAHIFVAFLAYCGFR